MRGTLSIILQFLVPVIGLAQSNTPFDKEHIADKVALQQAQDAIDEGDKEFNWGGSHFPLAIPSYEKAYAVNPDNAELNMKLGLCYLNSRYRHLSLPYFKHVVDLDPNFPRVHFLTAYAYQLTGQWDAAIAEFQVHKKENEGLPDPDPMYNGADQHIVECKYGKSFSQDPAHAQVENLGPRINSSSSDYGVLFNAGGDTMYFTSRRANTTGGKLNKSTNEYFEDIYVSTLHGGQWSDPAPLPAGVNTNGNDATMALCRGGSTMLIYRDEGGSGDIWQSDRVNGTWATPKKLGTNVNCKAHESSAFITNDGKWLYFVSDRDGGLGGQDIWRCQWSEDLHDWGTAENLGPSVNTVGDEESVFLTADGNTLYYSSQGFNSMGGFDVFRTSLANDQWSKPENLGWPINGADDDLFYVLGSDGVTGYMSSVRSAGWGDDDLYRVSYEPEHKSDPSLTASAAAGGAKDAMTMFIIGKIMDMKELKGIEADIEMLDLQDVGLSTTFRSKVGSGEFDLPVEPGHTYSIHVRANGFLLHAENFTVPADGSMSTTQLQIGLNPIEDGSNEILNNIFFEKDEAALASTSLTELGQLIRMLRDNPQLRLEIAGYSDSDGSAEHNTALSEARAQAVVDHLVANGIVATRLEAKGYGAAQPVADNDTEEHKALNRRTELHVLAH